jgi:hypothetical protein
MTDRRVQFRRCIILLQKKSNIMQYTSVLLLVELLKPERFSWYIYLLLLSQTHHLTQHGPLLFFFRHR